MKKTDSKVATYKEILGSLLWGHADNRPPNPNLTGKSIQGIGRRVRGNTLWLLLGRISSQGLMVLFTLIVARRLGDAGLGTYALMAAVVFLGNVVSTFGTDMLIIRELAAHEHLKILFPALLVQLSISSLIVGFLFWGVQALPNQDPMSLQAVKFYSLALFPLAFYTTFSAALRGYERMDLFMWLNLFLATSVVASAWIFLDSKSGAVNLAWLLLISQTASAILAFLFCSFHIPGFIQALKPKTSNILYLLRNSAPIAFLGMLKVLYQRMSIYLLSILIGAGATGLFSAALRTVEASQMGHIAFLGALFPVMAQTHKGGLWQQRSNYLSYFFSLSRRALLFLGLLISVVLFISAPSLVSLLFGSKFEMAIPALRVLSWIMIPYSINIYLSSQLLSEGLEQEITITLLVSLVILLGLNLWWIPIWGLLGACWAALAAETAQAGVYLFYSRRLSKNPLVSAIPY